MDLRKLKTLIDLVSESNVSELEITEAEGKVRIVKGPVGAPVMAACSGASNSCTSGNDSGGCPGCHSSVR
jgi:acetyl-CoA carboxylase biotin carboxyl carrier protein